MIEKNKATEFIDTQNSLNEFVKKLDGKAVIGIDTEFERIRTYYPKLCLIQVASSDSMACIDCLANLDLSNFWELIYREDIEKFIHSGSQDLEIFYLENNLCLKIFLTLKLRLHSLVTQCKLASKIFLWMSLESILKNQKQGATGVNAHFIQINCNMR